LVHLLQLHIISLLISSLLSGHYWPMPHLFASLLLLALATPSAHSPIVYGRRFQFFYPYQSIHHGYPSLLGIYRLCYCFCTISVDSLTILSISWSHVFRMSWVFFDLSTQCGVWIICLRDGLINHTTCSYVILRWSNGSKHFTYVQPCC
jgi:hypothetical protein